MTVNFLTAHMSRAEHRPKTQTTVAESYIDHIEIENDDQPRKPYRSDGPLAKREWLKAKLDLGGGKHRYLLKLFVDGWYPKKDGPDVVEARKAFFREVETHVWVTSNAGKASGICQLRRFYIPTTNIAKDILNDAQPRSQVYRSPAIIMDRPSGNHFWKLAKRFQDNTSKGWLTRAVQVDVIFGLTVSLEFLWRHGIVMRTLNCENFYVTKDNKPCFVNFDNAWRLEGATLDSKAAELEHSLDQYGHLCFIVATGKTWTEGMPPQEDMEQMPKCLRGIIEDCTSGKKGLTFLDILDRMKGASREDLYGTISDTEHNKSQEYIKSAYDSLK